MLKSLQEANIIPIARAQMRLRIVIPNTREAKKVKEKLVPLIANIEDEDWSAEYELVSVNFNYIKNLYDNDAYNILYWFLLYVSFIIDMHN